MKKAQKSFKYLIDSSKEAMKALEDFESLGMYDVHSPKRAASFAESILDKWEYLRNINNNEELPQNARMIMSMEILHSICEHYQTFFDYYEKEVEDDKITDLFFKEGILSVDYYH